MPDFVLRISAHLWLFKFNGNVLESMIFSGVMVFCAVHSETFHESGRLNQEIPAGTQPSKEQKRIHTQNCV